MSPRPRVYADAGPPGLQRGRIGSALTAELNSQNAATCGITLGARSLHELIANRKSQAHRGGTATGRPSTPRSTGGFFV
jgi:hypothetical protein